MLFRYLQEIETLNIQVFVTSHSPTITAKTRLGSLVVLNTEDGRILSTPLRNIALNEQQVLFLQRFLDVTKCQLFFSNSVILVEGISEALLMPSFARAMGDEYDLDRNAVEVVNIDGVAFEPFARLFNSERANERINVRCAILTDDDRTPSAEGAVEADGASVICGLCSALSATEKSGQCCRCFQAASCHSARSGRRPRAALIARPNIFGESPAVSGYTGSISGIWLNSSAVRIWSGWAICGSLPYQLISPEMNRVSPSGRLRFRLSAKA